MLFQFFSFFVSGCCDLFQVASGSPVCFMLVTVVWVL